MPAPPLTRSRRALCRLVDTGARTPRLSSKSISQREIAKMIHDNELHAGLTHALFCLSKWQQHRDSHKERHQFPTPNQIANTTQSLYFIHRLRSAKLMTCKQQFSSQAMSFTKILTSKSHTRSFIEPFKILNTTATDERRLSLSL